MTTENEQLTHSDAVVFHRHEDTPQEEVAEEVVVEKTPSEDDLTVDVSKEMEEMGEELAESMQEIAAIAKNPLLQDLPRSRNVIALRAFETSVNALLDMKEQFEKALSGEIPHPEGRELTEEERKSFEFLSLSVDSVFMQEPLLAFIKENRRPAVEGDVDFARSEMKKAIHRLRSIKCPTHVIDRIDDCLENVRKKVTKPEGDLFACTAFIYYFSNMLNTKGRKYVEENSFYIRGTLNVLANAIFANGTPMFALCVANYLQPENELFAPFTSEHVKASMVKQDTYVKEYEEFAKLLNQAAEESGEQPIFEGKALQGEF